MSDLLLHDGKWLIANKYLYEIPRTGSITNLNHQPTVEFKGSFPISSDFALDFPALATVFFLTSSAMAFTSAEKKLGTSFREKLRIQLAVEVAKHGFHPENCLIVSVWKVLRKRNQSLESDSLFAGQMGKPYHQFHHPNCFSLQV